MENGIILKDNLLEVIKASDFKEQIEQKEQSQRDIIEAFPFIEIQDNKTWEQAKKNRTALVTARTSLEKEKKIVLGNIRDKVTTPISKLYDDFIEITKPHEEKQQAEVKRYEAIKEEEKKERIRKEEERKNKHRETIKGIVASVSDDIARLDYESSLTYEVHPVLNGALIDIESLEEFGAVLLSEIETLKITLLNRKSLLKEKEALRIEKEQLEALRKETERKNKELEERNRAEQERIEAEKRKEETRIQELNNQLSNEALDSNLYSEEYNTFAVQSEETPDTGETYKKFKNFMKVAYNLDLTDDEVETIESFFKP